MSQIVISIPNLVFTICDDIPTTFLSFISPLPGSNFVVELVNKMFNNKNYTDYGYSLQGGTSQGELPLS